MPSEYQEPSLEPSEPVVPESATTKTKKPLTKKQKAAVGAAIVTVIILVGFGIYGFIHQNQKDPGCPGGCATPSPTAPTPTPQPTPTPTPAYSHLNGAAVEAGKENTHPLAVMIENHPEARPQAGLGQADVVYEAIAEGGITRFMAVFGDPATPVRVGPVRSARTYYVDFATEYNAFYAHVGGSEPALDQIKRTGVLDMDQFSIGEPVFQRDFSRKVALEHTMYSSTDKLWNYATNTRGWSKTSDYKPLLFTDDALATNRPASQIVKVSVSDPSYDVTWTYDPAANDYKRAMAGTPHVDANTQQQIEAKAIVLQTVSKKGLTQSNGKAISEFTLTGSGPVTIIENGTSISGTWKKGGDGRTRYYDSADKEIPLVRGRLWVHVVHSDSTVSY